MARIALIGAEMAGPGVEEQLAATGTIGAARAEAAFLLAEQELEVRSALGRSSKVS
jgi:hypothetical protein